MFSTEKCNPVAKRRNQHLKRLKKNFYQRQYYAHQKELAATGEKPLPSYLSTTKQQVPVQEDPLHNTQEDLDDTHAYEVQPESDSEGEESDELSEFDDDSSDSEDDEIVPEDEEDADFNTRDVSGTRPVCIPPRHAFASQPEAPLCINFFKVTARQNPSSGNKLDTNNFLYNQWRPAVCPYAAANNNNNCRILLSGKRKRLRMYDWPLPKHVFVPRFKCEEHHITFSSLSQHVQNVITADVVLVPDVIICRRKYNHTVSNIIP